MNTLVNMSLAGSAVLILWLLAAGVLKDRLPAPWHYRILKLSLFFFLVPVVRLVPAAARLLALLVPAPALPAATAPGPLPTVTAIPAAASPRLSSPALPPPPDRNHLPCLLRLSGRWRRFGLWAPRQCCSIRGMSTCGSAAGCSG